MHKKAAETETQIKTAFIALLQAQPFEKISVRDISTKSGINRGTFYLHYEDKYALLAHYEEQLITQLQTLMKDNFEGTMTYQSVKTDGVYTYPVVEKVIRLVCAEFDLFKVLMGPNGDPRFELRLKRIVHDAISAGLTRIKGQIAMTTHVPEDYAWELIISGLFTIIKHWLQSPTPASPQMLGEIIMKTRFLSPYDLLGISD